MYETLEQLTQYDVWIVVEDASAEHNLQAAPVKLVVQTSPAGPGNNMPCATNTLQPSNTHLCCQASWKASRALVK